MVQRGGSLKRIVHHYNQTFKMNFYFCLGWRQDRYVSMMKRRFDINLQVNSRLAHTCPVSIGNELAVAVWISKDAHPAVLAHECLHAVNMTLLHRGVTADFENDELQAYFLEELLRKVTPSATR